jgi:hypothetical protein
VGIIMRCSAAEPFNHKKVQIIRDQVPMVAWPRLHDPKQATTASTQLQLQPTANHNAVMMATTRMATTADRMMIGRVARKRVMVDEVHPHCHLFIEFFTDAYHHHHDGPQPQ